MSSAYGHAIRPMGGGLDSQKLFHAVYTEARQVPHWYRPDELIWRPNCSGRNCNEKPEFATRYLYVTGRGGRVTDRIQYWCRTHAEAFAKRHGLSLQFAQVSADGSPVNQGAKQS